MELFPTLYRDVLTWDALVSEYYNEINGKPQWSTSFRRLLRDFEEELHRILIRLLGDIQLWLEDEDKTHNLIHPNTTPYQANLTKVHIHLFPIDTQLGKKVGYAGPTPNIL